MLVYFSVKKRFHHSFIDAILKNVREKKQRDGNLTYDKQTHGMSLKKETEWWGSWWCRCQVRTGA